MSRVTSSGKDQEENEQQGCQSRETDHEVMDLLVSQERDQQGGNVDDTLSLFGRMGFDEDKKGNEDLPSDVGFSRRYRSTYY